MSFAYEIKNEICHNRPFRQRRQKALAYGLLLFGKTFGPDSISIHTEHRTLARLYADSISDLVGLRGSITMREVRRSGRRSIFVVTVDSVTDRIAVLSFFDAVPARTAAKSAGSCSLTTICPSLSAELFWRAAR